jgi:hypothetical protein
MEIYVKILEKLDGQERAMQYLTKMRKLIDKKNSKDCAKLFFIEYDLIRILTSYDPRKSIEQIDEIFGRNFFESV